MAELEEEEEGGTSGCARWWFIRAWIMSRRSWRGQGACGSSHTAVENGEEGERRGGDGSGGEERRGEERRGEERRGRRGETGLGRAGLMVRGRYLRSVDRHNEWLVSAFIAGSGESE